MAMESGPFEDVFEFHSHVSLLEGTFSYFFVFDELVISCQYSMSIIYKCKSCR